MPAMQYPFRVFANSNLGTQYDYTAFTGEWLPFKSTGQSPALPEVNLATGNVIVKSTFVKTQEKIGEWEFGFVYNAQNTTPWALNIPGIVSSTDAELIFRESDGSLITYTFDAVQNAYVAPSGNHSKSTIAKFNNGFEQVDPKTGGRKIYNASGNLELVYDARGFCMQYAYDAQGNLKTITSDAGVYTVNTANSVTTLHFLKTGATNPELLGTWNFDSSSRLEKAVIPGITDYTINYSYDGETNKLSSISQSDGTSVGLTYNTNNRAQIETIQLGDSGPHYTFNYNVNNTTITDALGFVTTATLNANNCIETFERQLGDAPAGQLPTLKTQCTYEKGDIASVTKPNAAETQFKFNSQGLVTQKINPNGQVTQYDYDLITAERVIQRELIGGTIENPIWATTRYVYNEKQAGGFSFRNLAFKISPLGAVTEYRYDATGALESERTYLQNNYDVSKLSPSTSLSLSDLQAWIATQSPSNITLLTCTENARGQRTSVWQFSEINSDGTGKTTLAASHDQFQDHTRFGGVQTHIQKMDAESGGKEITATTTQLFDNLQRVTSHQNALGETRSVDYSAPLQSVITEPNGRIETHAWNAAGQATSVTTAITGTGVTRLKTNAYDHAGRVSSITDCDGQITYQLFDSLNRLRFTVSPTGRVCEHFYDDVNRYQSETNYYTRLPIESLTLPLTFAWLQANLTKSAVLDATTYKSFDLSGRLQFEVDGRNAVIEHQYDLRNHEIITIAYDAAMTTDELTALKQGIFSRTVNPKTDRVNVNFYDADGRVIVSQDPSGYVTTYQRNPAGFLLSEYRYATPVSMMLNNMLVLPAKTADDFSKYYYHDAKGQLRVVVDGTQNANYIVEQKFYPTGKVYTETKYAKQAVAAPTLQSNPAALIPAENPEDQVTVNEFDLLNRLTKKHLPEMRLQEIKYDLMGQEIKHSVGDDPTTMSAGATITTQTTAKQFDDWGQLIAEAPPLVYAKILSIQNNPSLTPAQKAQQIDAVWALQALRYVYDDKTGLMTAKLDIVPDDVDPTNPANQAKTLYYCDADRRIVLTVGPEGQAQTTQWHAIFEKALEKYRYATAIDPTDLSKLTGGFISTEVAALLIKNAEKDSVDQYGYDKCGSETHHLDPDGFQMITEFNSFGEWIEKQLPIDSTAPSLTIARKLNLRGQCDSETKTAADGKSITTSREHNNLHGHCTSITDGNGATTKFTYDPRGTLFTSTDALGRTTTLTHDAFMREIKRLLPMGQAIEHVYVQNSRKVTTNHLGVDGKPITSTAEIHDAFDNVITIQDAEGNVTQITFNLGNEWDLKKDVLGNEYAQGHDLRGLLKSTRYGEHSGLYSTSDAFLYTLSRALSSETHDVDGLDLTKKTRVGCIGTTFSNHNTLW